MCPAAYFQASSLSLPKHFVPLQSRRCRRQHQRRSAAWAEQCRQQRQSCNGLISPKATQIFSKAVQFFGKVNHDTWEKFIPLRDSLFHSRNNLPSTKRFHRKMLKTCMSFLLEFVYCTFFPFLLYTNGTPRWLSSAR